MYPYGYWHGSPNNVPAFTCISGYAVRTPVALSANVISFAYTIENDSYIEIDTLATGLHSVTVGNIEGKRIEVVHKTDDIDLLSAIVINGQIVTNGKGSMTLKAY